MMRALMSSMIGSSSAASTSVGQRSRCSHRRLVQPSTAFQHRPSQEGHDHPRSVQRLPSEIEAVLYQHPAVREAAVVGIPHTLPGEEVDADAVKLLSRS
jgi:hypothetical protein